MVNNSTSLCYDCIGGNATYNPGDVYLWVGFVVVLAIFVSNLIPLIVLAKNSKLRKHRFFRFLISLSINAILTSPFLFTATIFRKITPVDDFSKIRVYYDCMLLQSYLHQGIIATERFIATGRNFDSYRRCFTTQRQIIYLILSYIVVGAFASIIVGVNYEFDERNPRFVYGRKHRYILFIYGCIVLILLTIIIILSSVCTYRVIKSYLYKKRTVRPITVDCLQIPPLKRQSSKSTNYPRCIEVLPVEGPSTSTSAVPLSTLNTAVKTAVWTVHNLAPHSNESLQVIPNTQQTGQESMNRHSSLPPKKSVSLIKSKRKREIEVIKTFLLILLVVLCFNVPYWFVRVLIYIDTSVVPLSVNHVCFIISAAQYVVNPIIYFLRIDIFRKALSCKNHR